MLNMRLDVLQAARQLATVFYEVPKAEYSIQENPRDGSILVIISAKTRLETSPIIHIRYDAQGTMITVKIPPVYNPVSLKDDDSVTFFYDWMNRVFTEDEFVKANRDFWIKKGRIRTDTLF
ncbi:hypothetical protein LB169_002293 [Acinetobacter baumannii]|nr:hypothetical protein [Acinetobacter baumannii]EKX9959419.1 hypothetical protein [Acinetobacter baumannii]EKY0928436.1 hypothetical protein [Acinetobacter baumannii]EKY1173481.1 hypothetical protein [Acinetobacter baumannii]HCW3947859.1 hypothetical protein [Acinetobacter baumannii]